MPPKKIPSTPSKTDTIKDTLHLDGFAKQFMAEHIRGLIRMYAIHGVKDDGAIDLMYDILFLDPVTTRHFAQFQGMWKHRTSNQPRHMEWWIRFRAFLRDCFDKTRVQMNRYHKENPPLPTDTDTDPNSDDSDDCDDSERGKGHAKKDTWYPGTPKVQPPTHKRATPPTIIAPPPTIIASALQKKRKLDDISTDAAPTGPTLIYTFRVCIVDPESYGPESYDRWDDIFVHHSSNRWHLSRIEKLTAKAVHGAVCGLCPARDVSCILGCLVMPGETSLRQCDATGLNSNDSVATFFSITAYNPLIVVAVLKAMAAVPPSIARATPPPPPPSPSPPPQPRPSPPRTPGASEPDESPTPDPRFIAINHSAMTQPEVTATHHVECTSLQDESAASLEKESSPVLEESMSARVARMAKETAQIVEATSRAVVELQQQREARSRMAEVSVAIITHQDVNSSMSFTQLEASRLTPPWIMGVRR
ncbi:hypothetical protein BDD12DRAFT_838511 [Trichophaea hybrida]|nr:hypothetical protein BDD12DRAFT_838511 [Trichophaea hybrida]